MTSLAPKQPNYEAFNKFFEEHIKNSETGEIVSEISPVKDRLGVTIITATLIYLLIDSLWSLLHYLM